MIRLSRSQVQPIGLDLGFDSVKMLQLETVKGPYGPALSVVAAARQALPDEVRAAAGTPAGLDAAAWLPVAAGLVRQMVRRGGFVGRRVVAAVPREFVHVKNLRLPPIPPTEIDAAVKFEARNVFQFDTDQAHVHHIYAGEIRQGNDVKHEVIALAVKNADVDNFLETLNRCGVDVEALDFEPQALYRGVERFVRRREDEHEVNVLVEFGARRSQVVIGRGREISFVKPMDAGGLVLNAAVARKLGISVEEARTLRRRLIATAADPNADAQAADPVRQAVGDAIRSTVEELAHEIALCLRYYSVTFRGHRPNKIRLVGGEAADPQVLGVLNAALPVPVELGRPLRDVDTTGMPAAVASDTDGLHEWATAFGLSIKKTTGYFGSREGKQRETRGRPGDGGRGPSTTAEVIDLADAVRGAEGAAGTSASPATPARGRQPEVAHA